MINIASNALYEIHVLPEKNRMKIRIIGFWRNPEVVPDYLSDLDKATKLLTSGFTVLADLREMLTHPTSVLDIHERGFQITKEAGVRCSAEVIDYDMAKKQMDRMYRENMVKQNKFDTIEEATQFLDSLD